MGRRDSKRRRASGMPLLACAAVALGAIAMPAQATILVFDQERSLGTQSVVSPTSSGGLLPPDYGDNVTGPSMEVPGGVFTYGEGGEGFTPDVTVDIFSAGATAADPRARLWQNGYGDLVNVVFAEGPGTAGAPMFNILLRASAGFSVGLYGFDLAGFGSDYTIARVEVLAGTTSLFSATNVLVEGDAFGAGHTSFNFPTPLSASELLVVLDFSNLASGVQDNIGLDSVRFGQTPEPGTALLLLLGLVALRAYGAAR
jgi:hypothetical protein